MMTNRSALIGISLFAFALLVAATPVDAQRRGAAGGPMGGEMMEVLRFPRLLEAAIEHAAEVGLEEEAILLELVEMNVKVDEVFGPVQERMLSMRSGDARPRRGAMREVLEDARTRLRPHMQRFEELVGEEQREALLKLLPPPPRGGPGGGR